MRAGEYLPRLHAYLIADADDAGHCWAPVVERGADGNARQCRSPARYLYAGEHLCGLHLVERLRAAGVDVDAPNGPGAA